ncbi:hypothetical protein ES702_02194 [subsurface metagenome]
MSTYTRMGTICATVVVSMEPDRSGNFVCDGTLDAVELSAAITYLDTLGGGEMFVLRGTYVNIGAPCVSLNTVANISLIGEGKATVFQSNWDCVEANSSTGLLITHICTHSDTAAWVDTNDGIDLDDCQNCIVSHCWVTQTHDQGIVFDTGCTDCICDGNIIGGIPHATDNLSNGISLITAGYRNVCVNNIIDCNETGDIGIRVAGSRDTVCFGNKILNPRIYGIYCATELNSFIDNTIRTTEDTAPTALIYIINATSCIVSRNHLISALATDGIYLVGNGGTGTCIITDNIWRRELASPTLISIRLVDLSDSIIANNLMRGGNGGDHLDLANCDNNTIVCNHFVYAQGGYGIDIDANSDNNRVFLNTLRANSPGQIRDLGTNTALPTLVLQFIEGGDAGGPQHGQFIHADANPMGWEINLAAEWAIALGVMPPGCQQTVRIKVWAAASAATVNKMRVELIVTGAQGGEAWNAETVQVIDKPSNETNFAINDIITWTFDVNDDEDIDDLLAGDCLEIKVKHEDAGNGDIATDAVFRCVTFEYV